ncbi:hypothetical protein ScPMuIL_006642 [Solemya velum]
MDFDQTQAIFIEEDDDIVEDEAGERKPVAQLRVHFQKGFPEKTFPVFEGENVIGRNEDSCDVYIPLPALSRRHACIEIKGSSHFIFDMGSQNKTRRGKTFLVPHVRYEVKHNDILMFGDVQSTYLVEKKIDVADSGSETGSESMFETVPTGIDNNNEKPCLPHREEEYSSDGSDDLLQPTQPFEKTSTNVTKQGLLLFQSDSDSNDSPVKTEVGGKKHNVTVKDTPAPKHHQPAMVMSESGSETDDETELDVHGMETVMIEDTQKDYDPAEKDILYAQTQACVLDSDTDDDTNKTRRRKSSLKLPQTQVFSDDEERESEDDTVNRKIMDAQTQAFVEDSESEDETEAKTTTETVVYKLEPPVEPTVPYKMISDSDTDQEDMPVKGKQNMKDDPKTEDEKEASTEIGDDEDDDITDVNQLLMMPTLACDVDANINSDDEVYDQATQVFPDETNRSSKAVDQRDAADAPTQVFENEATQVFEDDCLMDKSGKEKEYDDGIRTGSPTKIRPVDNDATQVFEEATVFISTHESLPRSTRKKKMKQPVDDDSTQTFSDHNKGSDEEKDPQGLLGTDSEKRAALTQCQGATLDVRDNDIAMDQATVAVSEDTTDSYKSLKQRGTQRFNNQQAESAQNEDATQIFGADDATVAFGDDATLSPPSKKPGRKGKQTQSTTDEEATQVFSEDVTVAVVDIAESPPKQKKTRGTCKRGKQTQSTTDGEATQVFCEDATVALIDIAESPPRQKKTRGTCKRGKQTQSTTDEDATQVFSEDDATVALVDIAESSPRQKKTPRGKSKLVEPAMDEVPTQVFPEDGATVALVDPTMTTDAAESPPRPKRSSRSKKGRQYETPSSQDATQVFGEDDGTVAIEDDAVTPIRQKRVSGRKRGKQANSTIDEDATQVFSEEEATVAFNDIAESSPKQKKTPRGKSKLVEPAMDEVPTQVFPEDGATMALVDSVMATDAAESPPRPKRSPRSKKGRQYETPASQDATQVFGEDDGTVTIEDDALTPIRQKRVSGRKRGKQAELTTDEEATQVFSEEDATLSLGEDVTVIDAIPSPPRQKRTVGMKRGKQSRSATDEDATQEFGEEDATVGIDDEAIAVATEVQAHINKRTLGKKRGRQLTATDQDATKVIAEYDVTVTDDATISDMSLPRQRRMPGRKSKVVGAPEDEDANQVFNETDPLDDGGVMVVEKVKSPLKQKRASRGAKARQVKTTSKEGEKDAVSVVPGNIQGEVETDIEATQPYCNDDDGDDDDDDDATPELKDIPSAGGASMKQGFQEDEIVFPKGRYRGRRSEPVVQTTNFQGGRGRGHLRRTHVGILANAIEDLPALHHSDNDDLEPTQPYCMGNDTTGEEVIPDSEELRSPLVQLPSRSPLKSALASPSPRKKSPSPKRVHFGSRKDKTIEDTKSDVKDNRTSRRSLNVAEPPTSKVEHTSTRRKGRHANQYSNNKDLTEQDVPKQSTSNIQVADTNTKQLKRTSLPLPYTVQSGNEYATRRGRKSGPATTTVEEGSGSNNKVDSVESKSDKIENTKAATVHTRGRGSRKQMKSEQVEENVTKIAVDNETEKPRKSARGRSVKSKPGTGSKSNTGESKPDSSCEKDILSGRLSRSKLTLKTGETEVTTTQTKKMKRNEKVEGNTSKALTKGKKGQQVSEHPEIQHASENLSSSNDKASETKGKGRRSEKKPDETQSGETASEKNENSLYGKANGQNEKKENVKISSTLNRKLSKGQEVPDEIKEESKRENVKKDSSLNRKFSKRHQVENEKTKELERAKVKAPGKKDENLSDEIPETTFRKRGARRAKEISETPVKKARTVETTLTPKRNGSSQQSATDASPSLRRKTLDMKPRVMFTGVVDEHGQKIVKELGGELATSVHDCSHLVTDKIRRTVKFLCCLSRGIPIVLPSWLDNCKRSGIFTDCAGCLVRDPPTEKQYKFSLQRTLDKSRVDSLLEGYRIHVTKSVKPEPSQMQEILVCSGAEYMETMPVCYGEKTLVISCKEDRIACEPALQAEIPVVAAEFILTGLLRHETDIAAYPFQNNY